MGRNFITHTSRKFENLLSIVSLFGATLLLIFTLVTAIYIGYSQRKIIDDIKYENKLKVVQGDTLTYKQHSNILLKWVGIKRGDYSSEEYEKILNFYFDASILLTSLYASLFTFIAYNRFRKQLRGEQSIQTRTIDGNSQEDLRLMLKFYKGADNVTVYSGDFSWIKDNIELQAVVLKLASSSKIKLISTLDRKAVVEAIGNDMVTKFENPGLISYFNNGHNIRCSLIEFTGELVFLYKVKAPTTDGPKFTFCILHERKESKYLLKTIENLMRLQSHA